jgi:ABC-type phosphate/phosphonate transport system substrate-binding protein
MYSFMTAASFMSLNLVDHHRRIAEDLGRRTGIDIRWEPGRPLAEVDLAFSCGLPLARSGDWTMLVAPVGAGSAYAGRPVYFTYFVVARDHPARRFEELAGTGLVMNEPVSHSGFAAVLAELASRRIDLGFFGGHRFSGGHQSSVGAVADGSGEVAAVDSLMFDALVEQQPELADRVRVAATGVAWPAPPLAVRSSLLDRVGEIIAEDIVGHQPSVPGVSHFATVDSARYSVMADNWRRVVPTGGIVSSGGTPPT